MKARPVNIDEYIEQAPAAGQTPLKALRQILREAAPGANEIMKWGKPAFELDRVLFVYSAHNSHLSFVPTAAALKPFEKEIAGYVVNKDSIQFPYNRPLPSGLIRKIAAYRVKDVVENDAKWKY